MIRVTEKDLEAVVRRINEITQSPMVSYIKDSTGKLVCQVGNYHLDYAYGGVALHRTLTKEGGIKDVLLCGYVPKAELHKLMQAFIEGIATERMSWVDAILSERQGHA